MNKQIQNGQIVVGSYSEMQGKILHQVICVSVAVHRLSNLGLGLGLGRVLVLNL